MYFSHRSGGPCWSRERGYHQPDPMPPHIMRTIVRKDSEAMWYAYMINDLYGAKIVGTPQERDELVERGWYEVSEAEYLARVRENHEAEDRG